MTSDTHADHAAEHGTHEKKSGLPQFDVTTFSSQLFWLFITFSILYVFFAKKALPALSSTIDTRKTTIRNDIDAANKLSADVDAIKAEYEEEMAKAHNEARLTRLSVENSMREKAEAEAHLFKEKSMSAISDLEQKAEIAKQKIQEELLGVASQVTKDIVEKLSPLNLSENDIQTAVNTYIEKETASTSQKKAA